MGTGPPGSFTIHGKSGVTLSPLSCSWPRSGILIGWLCPEVLDDDPQQALEIGFQLASQTCIGFESQR
jgi:hypothetical protein